MGKGHPLPGSDEARHNEIPEDLEKEKGRGDDSPAIVAPDPTGTNPDGERYRYDDNGRGEKISGRQQLPLRRPRSTGKGEVT